MRGAFLLLSLMIGSTCLLAQSTDLKNLNWLTGSWESREGKTASTELWLSPSANIMLGINRTNSNGETKFFEYLRIEKRKGDVYYIASPLGRSSTEFELKNITENSVLFENPEHDFPQRIYYERNGDSLSAKIEGVEEGEYKASEWLWVKSKLE